MQQPQETMRETMNVVIVGHVDHGKSTLVGRLLADTGVLGDGKLEKVKATCERQGKPFEYAFLLDALEEEQGQGITIDAARVFFKSDHRDYIIIDAPGHVEFLRNMVTGAARAEAALLLIDAKEGVRENSYRHGTLLSMLGIRQVAVVVNKIDLVDYDEGTYDNIVSEYSEFLRTVGIEPTVFIPVSARDGDLLIKSSSNIPWYKGPSVLEAVDSFSKQSGNTDKPLRMVVQDIYKFGERGDDHRIIAGRIEAGRLRVGDKVVFSPSGKTAKVRSIEAFSAPEQSEALAGFSTALTLDTQLYLSRGEVLSHADHEPLVSTKLRVNLFWLGKQPMSPGKRYTLKIGAAQTQVTIDSVTRILDASELDSDQDRQEVGRHEVADLVLRTRHPIAFDNAADIEQTGRFVIVDGYDIAGGGIIRDLVDDDLADARARNKEQESRWVRGEVSSEVRAVRNGHQAGMIMFTGDLGTGKQDLAKALEKRLVDESLSAYLLEGSNVVKAIDDANQDIGETLHQFCDAAHLLLDAGLLVVSTANAIGLSAESMITNRLAPYKMFVVHLGDMGEDSQLPEGADLMFEPNSDVISNVDSIIDTLLPKFRG